jgi:hypothetical protein
MRANKYSPAADVIGPTAGGRAVGAEVISPAL